MQQTLSDCENSGVIGFWGYSLDEETDLAQWGRGKAVLLEDMEPAVSNADELRRLLGNSRFFLSFFAVLTCCAGLPPRPAQGFYPCTPQGASPLDPFSLARFLGGRVG